MNAAGMDGQKWKARAVTKFTKPGDCLLAEPCRYAYLHLGGVAPALPHYHLGLVVGFRRKPSQRMNREADAEGETNLKLMTSSHLVTFVAALRAL